jgi:hypothetical protein
MLIDVNDVVTISTIEDFGDDVNALPHNRELASSTMVKQPIKILSRGISNSNRSDLSRPFNFSPESSRPVTAGSDCEFMELGSYEVPTPPPSTRRVLIHEPAAVPMHVQGVQGHACVGGGQGRGQGRGQERGQGRG